MSVIARALATVFGAGYSPIAPGTVGTAVAVPLAFLTAGWHWVTFSALIALVTIAGIWAAAAADRFWNTHDNGRIVIDEVVGFWATVLFVDRSSALALVVGFVVFRFFDIAKPPPVRQVDLHIGGGAGVILDDIAAGIYGMMVMILGGYLDFWQLTGPF